MGSIDLRPDVEASFGLFASVCDFNHSHSNSSSIKLLSTMENRRPNFVARAGRNRKRLQFEIDLKEIHHNGFYNSCNKK